MTNEQVATKMSNETIEIRRDELREIYKETVAKVKESTELLNQQTKTPINWNDKRTVKRFLNNKGIMIKGTNTSLKDYLKTNKDNTVEAIINYRQGRKKLETIKRLNEKTNYRNSKTYWGTMKAEFIADSRGMFRGASNYFEGFTTNEIERVTGTFALKATTPEKVKEHYLSISKDENRNNYVNNNTCFALGYYIYHSMIESKGAK